jgi:hypothetical protein
MWPTLHGIEPTYPFAHSRWKASADPEVRDELFEQDWRNVDYIVMSNKMRIAMERNNADGRENWIFEALDDHSEHRCGRSSEETSRSRSTAWAPTSDQPSPQTKNQTRKVMGNERGPRARQR